MMNKYIIKSKKQVNDIRLGLNREVVRNIAGEYKEFKKNQFSKNTSDKCKDFTLFYDNNNLLEAIEFHNKVDLVFEDKLLFKMTAKEITDFILSKDNNTIVDGDYVTSKKLNISISNNNGKVSSILLFIDGYYD